jgi:hypothetical protein
MDDFSAKAGVPNLVLLDPKLIVSLLVKGCSAR